MFSLNSFEIWKVKIVKQKILCVFWYTGPVTICILSAFIIFDNIRIANSNRQEMKDYHSVDTEIKDEKSLS